MTPLLLVTGTGTEIGKTFVAAALTRAWVSLGGRIGGAKPVESGVVDAPSDVLALARASSFELPSPPPYLLAAPVSPHLAARAEQRTISLPVIRAWVESARGAADGLLVELPGGLFSPLNDTETNADLAVMLEPSATVLVASDRLGVLHDVLAATRAAATLGLTFQAILLSSPLATDASTGTNADELRRILGPGQVVSTLPRTDDADATARMLPILRGLLRPRGEPHAGAVLASS